MLSLRFCVLGDIEKHEHIRNFSTFSGKTCLKMYNSEKNYFSNVTLAADAVFIEKILIIFNFFSYNQI